MTTTITIVLLAMSMAATNARAVDCDISVSRFDSYVAPIIAGCAAYAGRIRDAQIIDQARDTLINAHIIDRAAFDGVEISWCDLSNSSGMVPPQDNVLLHPSLKEDTRGLAVVLAHEMKHVEQYRRWGSDGFKCRYVAQVLEGNGLGRSNSVEAEAYEFGDQALHALQRLEKSP